MEKSPPSSESESESNNAVGDFFGSGTAIDMDATADDGGTSVFASVFLDSTDFNASRGSVIGSENKSPPDGRLVIPNKSPSSSSESESNNPFGFFGAAAGGFAGADAKGAGADAKGAFPLAPQKRPPSSPSTSSNNQPFDLRTSSPNTSSKDNA